MKYFGGAVVATSLCLACTSAEAQGHPEVLVNPSNQPAACVTPGRLMAFLRARNPRLRDRFHKVAVAYMKHGEALRIRWDYAFFQMMMETNSLKFTGDVHWSQNNFAGLGATGGGVKGERFASVSKGVRAHLEHLLIYAGVYVDNPVADRTRKVQKWKVLAKWQRSIRGNMTFGHIGQKWAPSDRGYASDIRGIAQAFARSHCNRPDPRPDLLAEARGTTQQPPTTQVAQTETQRPAAQSDKRKLSARASLGASTVYRREDNQTTKKTTPLSPNVKVLNNAATSTGSTTKPLANSSRSAKAQAPAAEKSTQQPAKVASAAGNFAAKFATPWLNPATRQNYNDNGSKAQQQAQTVAPKPDKCRVWTASYGGQKAIIIKSVDPSHINYTVLDVNSGREKQEAAAYISAYAKGGKKIAEFTSQSLALDKAFKLCPDS